jgi:hypothetical protein
MAFQVTTSWDGILLNTLQAFLHAPTFCIHLHQAILHKHIWIPSTSNDLLMSTPAVFNCNHTGTCIQHPHNSNRIWLHMFLLHLSK